VKLTVGDESAGCRLDVWLAGRLPGLSRARVQALIRGGHVTVAGAASRPHAKLRRGMEVAVRIPPAVQAGPEAEDIPLRVLYEDGDIVVIDKPAGLVVHPAAGHPSGTLVNALLHRCRDIAGVGGARRPGIVHRLDKDTTGVMVAAKNDSAMEALAAQFKAGAVAKEYAAVVQGAPRPRAGRIETPIGRSRRDRKKMSARPARGRAAVTRYEVAEELGAHALLRVWIETGRTHQIRVHLAHIGHPVAGDRQYGRRGAAGAREEPARQMLHARRLSFRHPRGGEPATFEAPLPADMEAFIAALRAAAGRVPVRSPARAAPAPYREWRVRRPGESVPGESVPGNRKKGAEISAGRRADGGAAGG